MSIEPELSNVSRETMERLQAFVALLKRWSARINLIAPSTVSDVWQRHIIDSAQLFEYAPTEARHWVDLGSGGGLPGLVCALMAQEQMPQCRFTLIESDKRKSAFLMTAIRELGLTASVLTQRIEDAPPQAADIVSARALAPLSPLLEMVERHLRPGGIALLPKGKSHAEELAAARLEWQFDAADIESQTDPLARLLILKDIARG